MTVNPTPDELIKLTKEFLVLVRDACVREYFVTDEGQGDELQFERVFAALAAAGGAALVLWPFRTERNKDVAGTLFATAVRLWSRKPALEPSQSRGQSSSSASSAARSSYGSRFVSSPYGTVREIDPREMFER